MLKYKNNMQFVCNIAQKKYKTCDIYALSLERFSMLYDVEFFPYITIGLSHNEVSERFSADLWGYDIKDAKLFSLLHEIGHFKQLEKLTGYRLSYLHGIELHDHEVRMEALGYELGSPERLLAYRNLPLEREADEFAVNELENFKKCLRFKSRMED